ncbi:MAG: DedA family protein [Actinobacteria bacterium]|nr:DedA family protein [Actinomycetota bacterium]
MNVDALLISISPVVVYVLVALVIGLESMGIPLPGEVILVSAALLASRQDLDVSAVWVAVAASAGAVVGDSIGYLAGRHWGDRMFDVLGRRFPKHAGPDRLAYAEHVFARYGVWAVFFGRFVALLRIFAGPVAGALRMPYPRFLAANALGGLVWAGGTTAVIYTLGTRAEEWLKESSWIGLALAVTIGIAISTVFRRRLEQAVARHAAERASRIDELEAVDSHEASTDGPGGELVP